MKTRTPTPDNTITVGAAHRALQLLKAALRQELLEELTKTLSDPGYWRIDPRIQQRIFDTRLDPIFKKYQSEEGMRPFFAAAEAEEGDVK